MMYYIETRTSPRAKWSRVYLDRGRTRDDAISWAREMDEHGGCGPIRVVSEDRSEIIKIG